MSFPQPSEYDDAIQNSVTTFTDAELRKGVNDGPLRFGMPGPVASGNFAVVYRFRCGGKRYAVKCFTRQPPPDQAQRFTSIHHHLLAAHLRCATEFQFLPQGIRVRGTLYPILKMEWLEAPTLLDFVPKNLHDRTKFQQLSESFLSLCGELHTHQIAHGDLQHGNLLVLDGHLRMIDYDGMCVPGTVGLRSEEDGLPHYQHPKRCGGRLSPNFDHFPSLVIWASLHALSLDPSLWSRYVREDERLLFAKEDFLNPQGSPIFRDLLAYGDDRLTRAVTALRSACLESDLASVPALTEVVPSQAATVVDPEWWKTDSSPVEATAAGNAIGSKPGLPTWLEAELTPVAPAQFDPKAMRWDRVVVYGWMAAGLAEITSRLADILSTDAMVVCLMMSTGLAGLRLLFSYAESTVVKEKFKLSSKLRRLAARLAKSQDELSRWKAQESALVDKEASPVQKQEAKLTQLQEQLRQQQTEADSLLQRTLQVISSERQQISQEEQKALRQLHLEVSKVEASHQDRLRRINSDAEKAQTNAQAQLAEVRRNSEAKKEEKLKTLRTSIVQMELRKFPIHLGCAESLTEANVNELAKKGILCAADFTDCYAGTNYNMGYQVYMIVKADGAHVRVPGIGEKRAKGLLEWRQQHVQRILAGTFRALPPSMASEIEQEATRKRQEIAQREAAAKAEADRLWKEAQSIYRQWQSEMVSKEEAGKKLAGSKRSLLDERERQERSKVESKKNEDAATINREIWQLQSVLNPAKHRIEQLRAKFRQELATREGEQDKISAEASSRKRDLSRFEHIRFGWYLAKVLALPEH